MSYHRESNEMVIHIEKKFGADMRIISPGHRQYLLNTIKMFYCTKTHSNLPIFGVRQKCLNEYHTSTADHKKGLSKVPLPIARMSDQDLINLDEVLKNRSFVEDIRIRKTLTKNDRERQELEQREMEYEKKLEDLGNNLIHYT